MYASSCCAEQALRNGLWFIHNLSRVIKFLHCVAIASNSGKLVSCLPADILSNLSFHEFQAILTKSVLVEIVEELSRSASSPEEKNNLQEGEIEVNSNLASPESKFKQGLSSKSHETKVHIQTFENAPGATGSSQNNNEEVDADKSTHTQNFDRGFKGNTQVLPEIYPTQVEVPEQESMDILASNRQSSSLEETSHEDISRIQEGKPSESNEQEPSGLRDHISDNHEENSALDERRMSGGEASTRNKSGVVKKNVESSLGWLDKAELESQLPPTGTYLLPTPLYSPNAQILA